MDAAAHRALPSFPTRSTRSYPASVNAAASPSIGSAPTSSAPPLARTGGMPSASAAAERNEPTRREHVERAGALADEVGRRLEPRVPADAAAGQERDALRSEEPPGRLRRVAGVRVLGEQADERAPERFVQRGEQERQGRLGDAGARGQRGRELPQALVSGKLEGERVENGTVHDG